MVTFRSLQSTFTSELLNSSSAAFRNRSSMIKQQLQPRYQQAFPSSFRALEVVAFRSGSVINEMTLSFDNTSVPNNTQISDVLINATDSVSGFDIEGNSITVDGTAITVTTTTAPTTTAAATTTTAPTTTTAATTTTAPTTTTAATTTTAQTTTAATTTTAPTTTTAATTTTAPTTTTAATTTTAQTTTAATRTTAPTTTAAITTPAPAASEPTYVLSVDLSEEPFSPELRNRSSPQFKALERRVVQTCELTYKNMFGRQFSRCIVRAFRSVSPRTTPMNITEVQLEVIFNRTTPISELPQNNVVVQTFVDNANASASMFNLTINTSTINVLVSPLSDGTTTTNPATDPTRTTAPTTATSPTATNAPTTATTAPTTTTTTVALTVRMVTFRSLQSTFTSDLLDSSSAAFRNRASMIKQQLQPRYQREFPSSFRALEVVAFRNGSVINEMTLSFDSTSVPSNTQIANVLINAAGFVIGFDIEGSSITVDGIASSGVSHKISFVTAASLALLSWLLANQQ
ncbi:cell wall protein DAN4-like isoform X2 [Echeneis naucrates]|uniref:cell wall protein DAN4-like isoform X2 n=1 Tax=Echeneis naucrates TaxID=173247 RepID=UPI001113BB68|nr:cell wall protein DAN4-like isoform X2 [Echeneis naucrates]